MTLARLSFLLWLSVRGFILYPSSLILSISAVIVIRARVRSGEKYRARSDAG